MDKTADALRVVIPSNWLDPLLTGDKAVIGKPPYDCKDIERLLNALRERMEAELPAIAQALENDRRYRWLRDAEAGALDRPFIGYRNSNGFSQFVGEYADTAIDAAIATTEAAHEA